MVRKQKERPVATSQNQTLPRLPTTTASFVYQTSIPVCLPASNNVVSGILLINNVFTQRCLLPSLHHPRTLRRCHRPVAPRRYHHLPQGVAASLPGACLPTTWYVPVHHLPYHRGIDPSERSHRAAYCLQQHCLVRQCVVFTNSVSHPSERWHRGCLAKPWIKSINCNFAPVCVRWPPSVRWHRGAQKIQNIYIEKPVRTRCHLTHDYGIRAYDMFYK